MTNVILYIKTNIETISHKSLTEIFLNDPSFMLWNKKISELLAPSETASFFEERRREKDRVKSGCGFVRSENLVAPYSLLNSSR